MGQALPGGASRFAEGDFGGIERLWRRWSPRWQFSAEEVASVRNTLSAPGSLDAAIAYYQQLRPWMSQGLRRKISVPTLALGGLDDTLAQERSYHRAASMFVGPYRVVMCPGGHFLHREAPEAFLGAALAFLRGG